MNGYQWKEERGHPKRGSYGSVDVSKLKRLKISYGEYLDGTAARQLLRSISGQEISTKQQGGKSRKCVKETMCKGKRKSKCFS